MNSRSDLLSFCSSLQNNTDIVLALMLLTSLMRYDVESVSDIHRLFIRNQYADQYGTAVFAQLHGYRLYYFLPDP